ncbi:PEP-CTERM sorting domain-containing protein [Accumulibacter sp.]|uniref:PEP-CTERM sorting domain-containing protein n=1 Tax=Accumulibacter sp. TaxID=2053492 RepID=UPI0025DB747B|nr:PEP-CTERM sorting domain-containing protein [Accumulibacter sp.]MCM8595236.1 PEP-CTERM sorting domain-containing protein [Accumulibacter sp.]MCM8626456.1 PEP-CTERM sorting domain-containing protein [Accumulibacter sp.]MDS4049382.1 PEP-CTERM sorting domain-containing protein [Accumulibacter sp.]
MKSRKIVMVLAIGCLTVPFAAQAALVQGSPTSPSGAPANPIPRFGTLIDFDDQPTGTTMASNQYAAQGVASITDSLSRALGYYPSSQSGINYVGTGPSKGWSADFYFEFTTPQAAVGIGIAGPTTMLFELLDASSAVLESYNVQAPSNDYYYINRVSNDARYLHISGSFIAIDDLQFDTRTVGVPEPASLALFGLGLAGLASLRRRNP